MLKIIELEIDLTNPEETGVWEIGWVEEPAIEQELMFFGRQKFYKAPEDVAAKACRAIKENEKRGNPAATQVGKVRGQQLCSRSEISLETLKRMKSYLERAETYYTGDYDDNGTISYDLWGGKPALEWTTRILDKIESQEMQEEGLEDACWKGYIAIGMKPADDGSGRMVPNCVPEETFYKFVYPSQGESESEFISRCMASSEMNTEFPEPKQRAAVCYSYWRRKDEFSVDRIGFDWEVLRTEKGERLFRNELMRGLPVIFIKGLPTEELMAFVRKYRIPISAINMYQDWREKVRLVQVMDLERHYDLDPQVRAALGDIAMRFDYDVSALPAYESTSGETDNMLVKPFLSSDCGCMKEESFDLIGFIDGQPVFETPEEAELYGSSLGCSGFHEHIDEDGNKRYMACEIHPENGYDEYSEEEKIAYDFFMEFKKTYPEKFQEVAENLRGRTEAEVRAMNHKRATPYFKYVRETFTEGDSRDFCVDLEDRYFRRMEIDLLRDTNTKFGHGKGGAPYSKWLYLGGPNCVHYWERWMAQDDNLVVVGRVEGLPGTPMFQREFNGYYNAETKKASERAYAISQNMSAQDFGLIGDLEPMDYIDGFPIYEDVLLAQDASFAIGCGGIYEEMEYKGKKVFRSCSSKAQKSEMKKQMFASDEEKRMIYTPLMIPNILIPRIGEDGERYFVKFTPKTIRDIQQKFMIEQRLRSNNYEHSDKKWNDIVMVESWIVDGESDKAYSLGFKPEDIPQGTWMGGYKVLESPEGDEIWNKYIKSGIVRGASVEGNFLLKFSEAKTDEYLLETIIKIINNIS